MSVLLWNETLFEGRDNLQIMGEKNICHSWRFHLSGVYSKGISSLKQGKIALEKRKQTNRLCSWFRQQNDIVSSEARKVNKPAYENPLQSGAGKSSWHTKQGRLLQNLTEWVESSFAGRQALVGNIRKLRAFTVCLVLILHVSSSAVKLYGWRSSTNHYIDTSCISITNRNVQNWKIAKENFEMSKKKNNSQIWLNFWF